MSKLAVKAQLGNWETEWGKCGEQEWECEEWDGNAVAGIRSGMQEIWMVMQKMWVIRVTMLKNSERN